MMDDDGLSSIKSQRSAEPSGARQPSSAERGEEEWSSRERTNHGNKGLISVDRRTKPTLILTIPRSLFKSSTKDLSSAIFEIVIQSYDLGLAPIRIRFRSRKVNIDDFQHGF